MPTITAKPGVSPSSAQAAANRVSQDIGGRSNPNWKPSGGGGGGGGRSSSSVDDMFSKYAAMIQANTAQNNAWSAQQAQINRDWQEKMLNANNAFNSQEAQKNRDWQERLSNTAHQREVKDLLAAGLNPVLSAMNGDGASTTSGATASAGSSPSGAVGQTDTSANGALVSLLGALVSSQVQQENARLSAQTNLAVAEKYNQMSKYTAELSSQTQLTTANISASTSRWIAELQSKTSLTANQASNAASMINAQVQAAAQRYGYQLSSWTNQQIAATNAAINKELKQMDINAQYSLQQAQLDYQASHPSNIWQAGGSVFDSITENGILGSLESLWNGVSGNSAKQNAFEEWSSNRSSSSRGSGFRK